MADSNSVLIALDKIQAQRHGSFAIVTADAHKNYYAQLAAGGETGLHGEVVGNEYLQTANRLSRAQQDELREREWRGDGAENWSKEWSDASTPDARQRIALDTLSVLHEVYGADGNVRVEVHLEGPGAKAASQSLSESGITPVSTPGIPKALLALLVLGLVLLFLFLLT
jgi:hypothetical protein